MPYIERQTTDTVSSEFCFIALYYWQYPTHFSSSLNYATAATAAWDSDNCDNDDEKYANNKGSDKDDDDDDDDGRRLQGWVERERKKVGVSKKKEEAGKEVLP